MSCFWANKTPCKKKYPEYVLNYICIQNVIYSLETTYLNFDLNTSTFLTKLSIE